jgi:hypothetical protein
VSCHPAFHSRSNGKSSATGPYESTQVTSIHTPKIESYELLPSSILPRLPRTSPRTTTQDLANRIILPRTFNFDYTHSSLTIKERSRLYYNFMGPLRKVPPVLLVNRESRTEALMHYTYHWESGLLSWAIENCPELNTAGPDTDKSE